MFSWAQFISTITFGHDDVLTLEYQKLDIASIICWTHHDIKLLGKILSNVSSFLANSEPSPTRNQEVQSGVEEPTLKQGQPDHSTIPVISSSEVCTDSESDDGEDLATARGLQEYKRWRTRRPKKTTQSLRRKPYGNDGTTRNLRHDYCTMPGQRIIQDEKLVRDTLLKSCGCTRKCMTQINASQIMLLRSGYCALGSRTAQNDYLKLFARDFKKLSDHDERLQPHLSLSNSPPIEVCQEAFCLVYGNGQGGLSLPHFKCVRERFGPEIISSRKQRQKPSFDLCAKSFYDIMMLCSRVSRDKLGRQIYHLSYGTKWRKMYEDRFVRWVAKHYPGADIPSESEFYAVHENPDYPFHNLHLPETPEKKKSAMEARDLHDKMVDIDHAWLVTTSTFVQKGHTGNEVDSSVFGSVKDKCKVSDIVCLFDIFKVAKEGLTKPNQLIYLRSVLDFRSSFQPHLLGIQRTMEGYFEFQLSDSRRSVGSRFPVVRGKKYLNELAEFGEWIPFMDGNPQGMPKPAPPTLDILPDNVKKTLKKLLRHPLLIKGEDRREWIQNFLATGGKDDGVRVIDEHEAGMWNIRVVEASSLPPLNLIEAADQRITVANEAYKSMLAADDGGRLHMKLIPSSTKKFKNIRTNDQSENQSADPECLPVSATVRESQLEKVVEGMHASMLALASKQEAL
eukprot:g31955.t1